MPSPSARSVLQGTSHRGFLASLLSHDTPLLLAQDTAGYRLAQGDPERYVCVCSVASVVSTSVRPHGLQPARLLCPWNSPGENTGVGYHALLQESSQARDRTRASCIAGRFFTYEASWEALKSTWHWCEEYTPQSHLRQVTCLFHFSFLSVSPADFRED
ncbi:hypothetical protein R6Z07F_013117 [Ovis aries]